MSLFLALFGHAAISKLSLLSGVKRKLGFETTKGSFWRQSGHSTSETNQLCRDPPMQRNANRTNLGYLHRCPDNGLLNLRSVLSSMSGLHVVVPMPML
jgi:hypothetical protein